MTVAAARPHGALQPRPPGGLLPGAGLSLAVHVGLVAAIALGVSWQRTAQVEFSAELWSALPEVAAPRTVEPAPTPAPPPQPAPAPAPAPPPPAPTRSAADIALERERALQREQAERDARLKREREAEAKRAKAAEQAALQKQRELQKQRDEERAAKAEEERLEKLRQDNLKRLQAQAGGGSGGPTSTGTATRSAAPSQQYGGILREHVRAQLKFDTTGLPPTLETVVEIRATASGTVLSRRIVKASGNEAWDNAVLRAIDAASPLPRDKNGTTPGSIEIVFRPRD